MHSFTHYVNPHLGKLLGLINMDKRFVQGEGCYLFDAEGNRYLDFIAAYGALPFGFNPPEIWQALQDVQQNLEPSFVQPSALEAAGELAKRLIELAPPGLRYVTFTNSGAEAVEAAIKLARAATGRLGVLTTENSFHGKTLGALSATGKTSYQQAFGAPVPGFARIQFGDLSALEQTLQAQGDQFAAFIVEPIQGEGGIVVPPQGYLAGAQRLCRAHGVLLIVDEIQTGLGRTGRLFACEEEGVSPDVMVIAKALGGGLFPIGAMLCTEEAYTEEFAMKHSSTFAGNTLACRVGLRVLELLTRGDGELIRQVAENGALLRAGLDALPRKYPNVVRSVRGRGYMLGIEFDVTDASFGRHSLLRVLAEQENLTPLLSSYLLNVERVRVAPTLNGASVIRIEPPLIATREQCRQVLESFDRTCAYLSAGNTGEFLGHLLGVERRPLLLPPASTLRQAEPNGGTEGRWGFVVHSVHVRNYAEFDESLVTFSDEELLRMAERWNDLAEPFLMGTARIVSDSGATAYGEFIGLPLTADQLLAMPHDDAVAIVRKAVDMARERGAQIVGLGAYTAVVTRGGLHLRNTGVALTTGNSFTVVAAVDAVYEAVRRLGTSLPEATIAVVGATGSIGRATSILLSEQIGRMILIGNPERPDQARKRLLKVGADIVRFLVGQHEGAKHFSPGTIGARLVSLGRLPAADADDAEVAPLVEALERSGHLVITTESDQWLPQADLVVTATSTTAELVTPDNLKFGAAVCDLSRPPNVSRAVKEARPDVLVIDGGIVATPGKADLGFNFGFEPGLAYACMAETMILGLEQHYEDTSIGTDLTAETILHLRQVAEQHGFRLAQLRSFDRALTDAEWTRLMQARTRVLGSVGD
jgi:acetylornithine/succinyldiaminopimelate/putrescine aminotransferase/predicted amino acid dehydrogenase